MEKGLGNLEDKKKATPQCDIADNQQPTSASEWCAKSGHFNLACALGRLRLPKFYCIGRGCGLLLISSIHVDKRNTHSYLVGGNPGEYRKIGGPNTQHLPDIERREIGRPKTYMHAVVRRARQLSEQYVVAIASMCSNENNTLRVAVSYN